MSYRHPTERTFNVPTNPLKEEKIRGNDAWELWRNEVMARAVAAERFSVARECCRLMCEHCDEPPINEPIMDFDGENPVYIHRGKYICTAAPIWDQINRWRNPG